MGYLSVDHSQTQGVDTYGNLSGKDGRLLEFDTVACKHCQAVIKIVIRGVNRAYATKHACSRCRGPICKCCATAMARTKKCPGSFREKIDRLRQQGAL